MDIPVSRSSISGYPDSSSNAPARGHLMPVPVCAGLRPSELARTAPADMRIHLQRPLTIAAVPLLGALARFGDDAVERGVVEGRLGRSHVGRSAGGQHMRKVLSRDGSRKSSCRAGFTQVPYH
jgi:hypothetical protein